VAQPQTEHGVAAGKRPYSVLVIPFSFFGAKSKKLISAQKKTFFSTSCFQVLETEQLIGLVLLGQTTVEIFPGRYHQFIHESNPSARSPILAESATGLIRLPEAVATDVSWFAKSHWDNLLL